MIEPGDYVLVLLDIGCLSCSEASLVRGVYDDEAAAARGFLRECERLEVPQVDQLRFPFDPDLFDRAGGSFEIAAALYRSVERDGDRRLSLMVARFLG